MSDEPSPRPWRVEANAFGIYIVGADDRKAAQALTRNANAALIVAAVNERDRLRDLVRRLVRVAIRDRETLRYIYSDVEYATEDDDAIGDALREARAAIVEDAK
jgi:hypothetical protein